MKKGSDKVLHFYFGEDDFTIAEVVKEEKESFAKKFGSMNVYEIDWQSEETSEEEKLSRLQSGLLANSLFSSDKLLIVKGAFYSLPARESAAGRDRKVELILKYLQNPQRRIKLFFIEKNLDKRRGIYKELARLEKEGLAEIREFCIPTDWRFDKWIENRVRKLGGRIGRKALNVLSVSLGSGLVQKDKKGKIICPYNLWEANNEIEKLVNFCNGREITPEDIQLLVRSKVDMNIFSLIDKIGSKDKEKAMSLLNMQIEKGMNEIYILSMLVYQFRNLVKVRSLLNQGLSFSEIASELKAKPFVVRKNIEQCQRFKMEELKGIYKKLADADRAIKTGKINPRLALDLLLLSI